MQNMLLLLKEKEQFYGAIIFKITMLSNSYFYRKIICSCVIIKKCQTFILNGINELC